MNTKLLKKVAREKGLNIGDLARLSGIKWVVLLSAFWGIREFRLLEIVRISETLEIDKKLVEEIFFE